MNKENKKITIKETFTSHIRALRIWHKADPLLLASLILSAICDALTPYAGIWFSAQIINELAGKRDPETLKRLVLMTLLTVSVLSLLKACLKRLKNSRRAGLYYRKEKLHTDKMLDLDFSLCDTPKTHDLLSQIRQNDMWTGWGLYKVLDYLEAVLAALWRIAGAIVLTVGLFANPVPESAGTLTLLNHPVFILICILLLLAVTFLASLCTSKADSYWVKQANDLTFSNRFFVYFGYLAWDSPRAADFRFYRQDQLCGSNFQKSVGSLSAFERKFSACFRGPMGLLYAASAAISAAFTGLIYAFVCLKAWAGAFGIGSVTQYIGAITSLSAGLSSLLATIGNMRSNAVFLRTTFEFLDMPNTMYQGSLTTEKRADRNYEIEFRNVSFRYPGSENWALRHTSIKFKIGQRLAVVGENGSGKTTFIKLLCRLYDPTEGEILLNGIDIRKYNYQDYLDLFSVVFQDFQLLSFPLGQNVAASADYDRSAATSCLQRAGFGDRLKAMPQGLDTCLYREFDEKGVEISGGEAQKIALARALYKDAPFIILDEPTAALDPLAEYEVYRSFDEIITDKTAVYISHRLSSCRFCDEIAVFDHGQIIQQGTHEKLVTDEGGKYYELWQAQAQYYATGT